MNKLKVYTCSFVRGNALLSAQADDGQRISFETKYAPGERMAAHEVLIQKLKEFLEAK